MLLGLLLVIVIASGLFYRAATTPYLNLTSDGTSSAAGESAQSKVSLVATAAEQAQTTHKPVPISITLADAEMTSLAAEAVGTVDQTRSLPNIDDVVIHAAGAGNIQVQAHVHLLIGTVPLYVALHLASPDQKSFRLTVTDARVGSIPLPVGLVGGIVAQVREQLINRLNVAQAPAYDHARVSVEVGRITFGATFEP